MSIRTTLGRFLTRFGRFIQSLAVMIMKPDDLVEFRRQAYSGPKALKGRTRFEQSGFLVIKINSPENSLWGSAIFRKPEIQSSENQGFKE